MGFYTQVELSSLWMTSCSRHANMWSWPHPAPQSPGKGWYLAVLGHMAKMGQMPKYRDFPKSGEIPKIAKIAKIGVA